MSQYDDDAAVLAAVGDTMPSKPSKPKESQATTIVRLVTESGAELWHTPAGDGYISARINGHVEHHPLASRGCRDYLTRIYYLEEGKAPNATAMQAAIATLSGIARFDGVEHHVYLRVAGDDDRVYLDLGDPQHRVAEVTAAGWTVITSAPVRFRRTRGMLALPAPVRGGSVTDLRRFVNVASKEDFVLMVSWLVATFRPTGPYPVLVLLGEQGSAKSTTCRVLRRLIDPNTADTRCEPREPRDLAIAADNGHVITLDNVSRLPDWLSDALCRLATGGGFSTRTLYENREEELFDAVKPAILNGIASVATKPDLVDRSIMVTLPVIRDRRRRHERHLWSKFEAARPRLLGALLDAVVVALRQHRHVELDALPRMADFAIWSVAAEHAMPWKKGMFLAAYTASRQGAVEAALDGDPVADLARKVAPWDGTATEFLQALNGSVSEETRRRKGWFSQARQVGDALRRLAPALRQVGIEVSFIRHGHTRARLIEITVIPASAPSAASFGPDSLDEPADAGADDAPMPASAGASADPANVYRGSDAADAADAPEPTLSEREVLRQRVGFFWQLEDAAIASMCEVDVTIIQQVRAELLADEADDGQF
jgi:hypothetical protein